MKGLAQGDAASEEQHGEQIWTLPGTPGKPWFPGLELGYRQTWQGAQSSALKTISVAMFSLLPPGARCSPGSDL